MGKKKDMDNSPNVTSVNNVKSSAQNFKEKLMGVGNLQICSYLSLMFKSWDDRFEIRICSQNRNYDNLIYPLSVLTEAIKS